MNEDYLNINQHFLDGLESFFEDLEKKARDENLKYERRLSASLRHMCRIYYPGKISEEQLKAFVEATHILVSEWGEMDRERLHIARTGILESGLTFLPVTNKATKEIAEYKKQAEINFKLKC